MKSEATKELTLADFQQQVAEKYGYASWLSLTNHHIEFGSYITFGDKSNEAAELYAEHQFEQGKQEGETEHYIKGFDAGLKKGEAIGWNEAIQWAAENSDTKDILNEKCDFMCTIVDKQSILNGLKEEE